MVDDFWLNKAINKTRSLNPNTVFSLKDLFPGVEWDELSNGNKRDFGRQFKHLVLRGAVPNVIFVGKADNNASTYKKVVG